MKRLKVGIVGCGAIAQIQHLPHLRELSGEFEIAGLCDLSPKLLAELGGEYGVPPERRFLDHQDLVRSDVDAVIVCPTGSHAAPSIAAMGRQARPGREADVHHGGRGRGDGRRRRHGRNCPDGRLHEAARPGYRYAGPRPGDVGRSVRPGEPPASDNSLHLAEFRVHRFDDVPAAARAARMPSTGAGSPRRGATPIRPS